MTCVTHALDHVNRQLMLIYFAMNFHHHLSRYDWSLVARENLYHPSFYPPRYFMLYKKYNVVYVQSNVQGVSDLTTFTERNLQVVWSEFFVSGNIEASIIFEVRAIKKVGLFAS